MPLLNVSSRASWKVLHRRWRLLSTSSQRAAPSTMSEAFPHFGTNAVHAGSDPNQWDMNQVVVPISLSATYKQDTPGQPKGHDYSRNGNPTRDVLQKNIAALEDGKYCRAFSSGMAAIMAMTNYLKTGDHVVCSAFGGTQRFYERVSVPHHGLQASFVDMSNLKAFEEALRPNTKMVWFESPLSVILNLVDIEAVVRISKAFSKEILVVVDNTFMSPYFQRPLALGADVVMNSVSKYINGHLDVLMGALVTDNDTISDFLLFQQLAVGAVPSAFDCYLVNRGIKTLHLRMEKHMQNALQIARFLEGHSLVEKVLYPELKSHPQHELHKQQTRGMSGMLTFFIKGNLQQASDFLASLKVFVVAGSLGSTESLASSLALMSHAKVPKEERLKEGITDNLIRLSVGIEDADDLIKDLDQALKLALIPKTSEEQHS